MLGCNIQHAIKDVATYTWKRFNELIKKREDNKLGGLAPTM